MVRISLAIGAFTLDHDTSLLELLPGAQFAAFSFFYNRI